MGFKKFKQAAINFSYLYLAVSSIGLIYFHKTDSNLTYNWFFFYIWAFNFCLALMVSLIQIEKSLYSKLKNILHEDKYWLFFILILAISTRFIFLTDYPLISMGDELRDAGLNAIRIKQGFIKDFFDFGSYQGYGNFIPLTSYFLSFIFKTSILIYRFPAAAIGVLSIFLTYLLARIWTGKYTTIIASLILIFSIRHLHYSRTEWEIIMDSLLSLVLILSAYLTLKDWKGFFVFGIFSGFIFHFYAGIRIFALILFVYLFCFYLNKTIYLLIERKGNFFSIMRAFVFGLILFFLGLIIGIGPTINNLNKERVFSNVGTTKPIIYNQNFLVKSFFDRIDFLYSNYEKAFSIYSFEPVDDFRFRYISPMINFPFNWFFLIGLSLIAVGFNKKRIFSYMIISLVMIVPLVNQVLIDQLKHDHRIIGILPFINIIAAYGFVNFLKRAVTSKNLRKLIAGIIIGLFSTYQLWIFFLQRPSDKVFTYRDYVFFEISQFMKEDKKHNSYYVMYDPLLYDFNLLHYKEGFEFYAYPKKVEVIDKSQFINYITSNNQKDIAFISPIYLSGINHYSNEFSIYCSKKIIPQYECPLNFEGKYSMFVYN